MTRRPTITSSDKNLWWETKSKKEILKSSIFGVSEVRRSGPDGSEGDFIVLDAPSWVNVIVPLTLCHEATFCFDDFLMVKQFRHGSGTITMEFPAGAIDKNESPLEAAKRELKEESGYTAKEFFYLGGVNPNPAFMSNKTHTFVAVGAQKRGGLNLDPLEALCPLVVKRSAIEEEIKKGDKGLMNNAIMIMAWQLFTSWEQDYLNQIN